MICNNEACDSLLKWNRIRDAMRKEGADACVLTSIVNIYYVAGQIYNGYFYLPAEGEPWFFVKRPSGWEGPQVEYIRKPEQIPSLLEARGVKRPEKLLLEADELSYNDYMRLLSVFQPRETGNATALLRAQRMVKTPWELEQFKISARQHAKTYAEIPGCFRPGMTDLEFQCEIERRMRRNGSLGVFRASGSMDILMGSVLAGANAETPSPFDFALGGAGATPSLPIGADGTKLVEGVSVMVDMAGNYTAYMTDMTRTFSIGKLPSQAYRMHNVARAILGEIEQVARPGVACADLYNIAARIVERESLSPYFMGTSQQAKFIGHGIGIEINELPVIAPRSKEILAPGMVIALEPKFVLPGTGALGIEDSYVVTPTGIEKLTTSEAAIIDLLG